MSSPRKPPTKSLRASPPTPPPSQPNGARPGGQPATERSELLDRRAGILAFVLTCVSAVLSGLLEILLVPLYVGSTPWPVAVAAAVVSNVVLTVLAFRAVGRPGAGVAVLICWLLPIVVLSMYLRPEGDVIILAQQSQEYTFYGVVLAGVVAAIATVVLLGRRSSGRRYSGSVRYR